MRERRGQGERGGRGGGTRTRSVEWGEREREREREREALRTKSTISYVLLNKRGTEGGGTREDGRTAAKKKRGLGPAARPAAAHTEATVAVAAATAAAFTKATPSSSPARWAPRREWHGGYAALYLVVMKAYFPRLRPASLSL